MIKRKLTLKTETIRALTADHLARAIGGDVCSSILATATHSAAGGFSCTCPRPSNITCPSDGEMHCPSIVW